MLKAEIYITLKETVVDPQGKTLKHALEAIGYKGLEEVRMGKLVVLKLDYQDKKKLAGDIEGMCKKLLANPIIENYSYKIKKV
ncbi:MAG: phosphoribosylformylglycinamidine synthase subunit PurS [Candidatus Omnitrophica bacterium]|nr:phosphoribosylformylglycinamidine synthase subunit PurS [Candidatus Omnitrophota bacterium]MBI5145025.1 phosphoribosylformylglycinamidine synthase subunit PurS [Candidatus Omnitrophota bacterium]